MAILKIQKKVSFHVARHTFATSFLRAGGQVEKLQKLLGHSDIKQTMIYVHIVQADANAEIFLLDNLF
jgi:site-specific recombinase XerD